MTTSTSKWNGLFLSCILVLLMTGVCAAESWVTTASSVTPQDLAAVWTTSSVSPYNTEAFCVGAAGTIIHYDGSSWQSQSSGIVSALNGIWGSSPDDVFAVGVGRILHYDGTAWSLPYTNANTFNAVWGSSSTDDIFAVGVNGIILHSVDGSSWESQSSGTIYTLNGVWGSSATDVYAVGENFTILHYDGNEWSQVEIDNAPATALNAVWGYSSDSVFVVGEKEVIIWYAGDTWTILSGDPSSSIELTSVWGASACNVYVSGVINNSTGRIYHFDGSSWSSQADLMSDSNPDPLRGIHGTSMRDVFAVGNNGTVLTYTLLQEEDDPQICGTSPAEDATGIAVDASVIVLFSTEMDPDTITETTFTLNDGTNPVSGSVSYEPGGSATFTPDADLDYDTTYHATLSTDIEDRFGYGIGYTSDYTWSFTTAEESSSGSSGGGGCFISTALPLR